MTKPKTIEILTEFNKWRTERLLWERPSPSQVTDAIDSAVKYLRESIKAGKIAKKKAMKAKKIG